MIEEEFDIRKFVNDNSANEPFAKFDVDKCLETLAQLDKEISEHELFQPRQFRNRASYGALHKYGGSLLPFDIVGTGHDTPYWDYATYHSIDVGHGFSSQSRIAEAALRARYNRFSETQRGICWLASPDYAQAVEAWDKTNRAVNWQMVKVVECLEKFFNSTED